MGRGKRALPGTWIVLLLLAGAFLPAGLRAESGELLAAFRKGLAGDPTYRGVVYTHKAASTGVYESWFRLLPSLSGSYERVETEQDITRSDNSVFASGKTDFPVDEYRVALVMPLFRWEVFQRIPQARAEERQAAAELLAAEQDLTFRVAEAYLGVLAGRDELDFALAERDAIAAQLEDTESRVRSGLSTSLDLHEARARLALADATRIDAEASLEDRHEALHEITGEPAEVTKRLREELSLTRPEPADVGHWVGQARAQNLLIQARREAVRVARKEIHQEASGHLPSVDFVASLDNRDTQGTLFGGGSEVETTELLVRVNVPLFDAPVLARTRAARHLWKRAGQDLEAARRQAERSARDAYHRLRSGVTQVEALRISVQSNQAALELREEGLRAGLQTGLLVLDARRDLFQVKRDHAQARYEVLLSRLQLEQAIGALGAEHLIEIDGWLE